MKIKKNTLYMLGALLIVIVMGSFVLSQKGSIVSGNVVSGDVQAVKMYVENGQYVFSQNEFKKGQTVRIEADISKMPGCSKSIVISAFNVRKTLTTGDNVIEFTPDKAGTFNIACSMNMYKGTFTVLDNDGVKAAYVEPANTKGSSCGSGGCGGCGG